MSWWLGREHSVPALSSPGVTGSFYPTHRKNVEKRSLLDNMDGAFLVVDEIVDGGYGYACFCLSILLGEERVGEKG